MSERDPETQERLVRIESAMAHLQHDVELLNNSLTDHFRRLQNFEARFSRIEHDIEAMNEGPELRDPETEKPPHY